MFLCVVKTAWATGRIGPSPDACDARDRVRAATLASRHAVLVEGRWHRRRSWNRGVDLPRRDWQRDRCAHQHVVSIVWQRGVLGYIESGSGLPTLRRNLPGLTSIGVDGLNLNQSGSAVSRPGADADAMLAAARRAGKTTQLLVGNYSSKINDFDPAIAHRLFISAKNRASVIAALVGDTRRGWSGIQLDLESLHGSDMAGLTRFTRQLRAALPANKTLSMAVMASTSEQGYRADAYDLPALAKNLESSRADGL